MIMDIGIVLFCDVLEHGSLFHFIILLYRTCNAYLLRLTVFCNIGEYSAWWARNCEKVSPIFHFQDWKRVQFCTFWLKFSTTHIPCPRTDISQKIHLCSVTLSVSETVISNQALLAHIQSVFLSNSIHCNTTQGG